MASPLARRTARPAPHGALSHLGAEAVQARVVVDRNRCSGDGVTADACSFSDLSGYADFAYFG